MILKRKKGLWTIALIALAIIALPLTVIVFFSLPWVLIAVGIWFSPNPPEPEIKYMEFPIELVYEVDSEIVTVQDVFVCEYAGIDANEGQGKFRVWEGHMKSSGYAAVFIGEFQGVEILCSIGAANYYMGDEESPEYSEKFTPWIYGVSTRQEPNGTTRHYLYDEEIYEKYRIRIISWNLPDPIKNTFK